MTTAVSGYEGSNGVTVQAENQSSLGMGFMSMAISTGISCAAAAYAVAETGKGAIASITEKPELFGRTIIYVGLSEGIAIYGLLTTFLIWITMG